MFSQKVLDGVIIAVLLAIALAFYGCMSTKAAGHEHVTLEERH